MMALEVGDKVVTVDSARTYGSGRVAGVVEKVTAERLTVRDCYGTNLYDRDTGIRTGWSNRPNPPRIERGS